MTIKDYITDKVKALRFELSASDLSDINKVVPIDAENTDENERMALGVLADKILPFYIDNVPSSITESGYAQSWKENLERFYSWLCDYLGKENRYVKVSKISDASDIW